MAKADSLDKTLRHMAENLNGAYEAVHAKGPHKGKRSTCSGTAILACCYMNGLGKVLLKGGPPKRGSQRHPRPDFARFQAFLEHCMPDFLAESDARGLPPLPDGSTNGDEWLYQVYRCGFIHGLPPSGVFWGWNRGSNKYWFAHRGRPGLNVDELVRGFHRGTEEFRRLAEADRDLRTKFKEYMTGR
jgi:hypothetical protein